MPDPLSPHLHRVLDITGTADRRECLIVTLPSVAMRLVEQAAALSDELPPDWAAIAVTQMAAAAIEQGYNLKQPRPGVLRRLWIRWHR